MKLRWIQTEGALEHCTDLHHPRSFLLLHWSPPLCLFLDHAVFPPPPLHLILSNFGGLGFALVIGGLLSYGCPLQRGCLHLAQCRYLWEFVGLTLLVKAIPRGIRTSEGLDNQRNSRLKKHPSVLSWATWNPEDIWQVWKSVTTCNDIICPVRISWNPRVWQLLFH